MIPYNPSSFDTNKTILEQILELKNWLKDHPSYEIFYSSENGNYLAYTGYLLSAITDPTNLAVGDVVIFNNVMVGVVTSVDSDNGTYGCDPCISFKGDTGATGQAGRSIRVSSENYVNDSTAYSRNNIQPTHTISQYDLVIFANDYLGYVSSVSGINFYVTATQNIKGADGTNGTNGTNGEDGAYVSAATVDGNGDLQITIYDPATSTTSTINAGHVVGPQGSGIQIVALTSTSGTLSADDLSKVTGTDDCIITYTNAGSTIVFKRASIDSSYAYFTNVVVDVDTYYLACEVNVTTGAYNLGTDQLPIKASNVNSETATNGQVLTADGNGGASWQNAGGGTTLNKYTYTLTNNNAGIKRLHNILENAKGRTEITGRFYDNTNNVNFVGKYISGTYWYIVIVNAFPAYHNYLLNGVSNSLSDSSTSISLNVRSTADLTTELTITSVNISEIKVTYWNDTEITS